MKTKLSLLLLCLVIGMSGVFISCKNDAPDIKVKTEDTFTSDFTGIVNILKDQNQSLEARLDALHSALYSVKITLDQKLELIELAVRNGITTYKECAGQLLNALDNKAGSDAQLQGIYDILHAMGATLDLKLAAIEAAINAGVGTYEEFAQQLIDAIKALDASQAEKLQAIYDVLKSRLATLSLKVEAVKIAIENGFISNKDAIAALQEAIVDALSNPEDLGKCIDDITEALKEIKTSLDEGFALTQEAVNLFCTDLVKFLTKANTTIGDKLDAIEKAIRFVGENFPTLNLNLLDVLGQIKKAILDGNDYTELIDAIKSLVDPEPEPEPEYEAVDLGLSVEWATFNVGAKSETDYGDYFAWGETAPKEDYNWDTYKWAKYDEEAYDYVMTKYNGTDDITILQPEDDAATANWGYDWRTPTSKESKELNDYCAWTLTTKKDGKGNNVTGYTVTSKENGNSIFLPAAGIRWGIDLPDTGESGYYWSSSLNSSIPFKANNFFFNSALRLWTSAMRYAGIPVRPVLKPSSERE